MEASPTIYEQDGRIIVSRLKDMSEAPKSTVDILVMIKNRSNFVVMSRVKRSSVRWAFKVDSGYITYGADALLGFIPMPQYIEAKDQDG